MTPNTPLNAPLFTVIEQVVLHTPHWVWGLLALITVLGLKQLGDNVVSKTRAALVPVALGAYSLWGATQVFGVSIEVLLAWMIGLSLPIMANQWIGWPGRVQTVGQDRLLVKGSVLPLLAMWAIFAVRYVSKVTLVFHPDWAHGTFFALAMPLVYGALSGIFAARALRILSSGNSAPALAAV